MTLTLSYCTDLMAVKYPKMDFRSTSVNQIEENCLFLEILKLYNVVSLGFFFFVCFYGILAS